MNEIFMKEALKEAVKAFEKDETPIGAVVVFDGKVIARAHNTRQGTQVATYHAEVNAIEKACKKLNSWRLEGCDLYVTMEPCPMCAGAAINARMANIYFGAYDMKAGCCGTLYNLPEDGRFNHRVTVKGGILEEQSVKLLSDFFRGKRKK